MAKAAQPAVVYQLKITLVGIKPPIWRRVLVKDGSLAKLHDIIQTVMGWQESHLHSFEVGGERYGEPSQLDDLDSQDESRTKLSQVVAAGSKTFAYTYDFGDNW